MFVAAVLDIVSESTTVKNAAPNVNVATSLVGTSPVIPSPTTRASPVDAARAPRASPPPNSRMVPQSICAACRQVIVVRWVSLLGSRKSSTTPISAATDSGDAGQHRPRHGVICAEQERQQPGADPQAHRHTEGDDGVQLTPLPGSQRPLPLGDDLLDARDLPYTGPPHPAEVDTHDRHQHQHDRHGEQHPLDERNPHIELFVDHADRDEVRRRPRPESTCRPASSSRSSSASGQCRTSWGCPPPTP